MKISMKPIDHINIYLSLGLMVLALALPQQVKAQPFLGAQTIGIHHAYVSLSVREKPYLGIGYNLRTNGNPINDWGIEWQTGLDAPFVSKDQQIILGLHRTSNLRSRSFWGLGMHTRIRLQEENGETTQKIMLAGSLIPSYTYANSLTGGLVGTTGLRLTPTITLAERKGKSSWESFSGASIEGGFHLDGYWDRSLTGALNLYGVYELDLKDNTPKEKAGVKFEGNLYGGSSYLLFRF